MVNVYFRKESHYECPTEAPHNKGHVEISGIG